MAFLSEQTTLIGKNGQIKKMSKNFNGKNVCRSWRHASVIMPSFTTRF